MLGDFFSWLVYGEDEDRGAGRGRPGGEAVAKDDDEGGFQEAWVADEGGDGTRRSSRRRREQGVGRRESYVIDQSGGGVIDLQCGRRVFHDVPAKMRTELWMSQLHGVKEVQGLYYDMVNMEVDASVESEIEKDTHRTFPGHATLSTPAGQRAMYRVLRAYAAYDPVVGYSQGMNFLAGLLLTYLDTSNAFGALVVVMKHRGLRDLYEPNGMQHLQARLWQLSMLVPRDVRQHLEAHLVLPVLYASSWLLTCFASEFPIKFAARIMDVLITDSYPAPLMKVAVQIMLRCREDVLGMEDMEDIVDFLRKKVPSWPQYMLQELLTEALGTPWHSEELDILGNLHNVESVEQAVSRTETVQCASKIDSNRKIGNDEEDTTKDTGDALVRDVAGEISLLSFEEVEENPKENKEEWIPQWEDPKEDTNHHRLSTVDILAEKRDECGDPGRHDKSLPGSIHNSPFSGSVSATLPTSTSQDCTKHDQYTFNHSMAYQDSMRQLLSRMSLAVDGSGSRGNLPGQLKDWALSTSCNWSLQSSFSENPSLIQDFEDAERSSVQHQCHDDDGSAGLEFGQWTSGT